MEYRSEIMIDFRVNDTYIDPEYSDNDLQIKKIHTLLAALRADSSVTISSVMFCGAASPEGSYKWNSYLAGARLAALEQLIRREVDIPDSLISRDNSYIPWDYLKNQVSQSDYDFKNEVISIIDHKPELVRDSSTGKLVDRRILQLKNLDNQRVWNELFRRYFSKMRNASVVIITYDADTCESIPLENLSATLPIVKTPEPRVLPLEISTAHMGSKKPFYMSVYTNMLCDLLAIPNIGAELYVGHNWSIGGSWMHAWWSYDPRHRYWRIYGGELNASWWFGQSARQKPLTGHHLGFYVQALTYDFEFGGKAYMGGKPGGTIYDRAHLGAGVEYGYSHPVSRRLNIDFTAGVGYIGGRVYEFIPKDDSYVWTATRHRKWIGPTKLEISLVWLIGRGNVNKRKGGALQ